MIAKKKGLNRSSALFSWSGERSIPLEVALRVSEVSRLAFRFDSYRNSKFLVGLDGNILRRSYPVAVLILEGQVIGRKTLNG